MQYPEKNSQLDRLSIQVSEVFGAFRITTAVMD